MGSLSLIAETSIVPNCQPSPSVDGFGTLVALDSHIIDSMSQSDDQNLLDGILDVCAAQMDYTFEGMETASSSSGSHLEFIAEGNSIFLSEQNLSFNV